MMRELEHLGRLHIAYQFIGAEQMSKSSAEELAKMTEGTNKMKERMREVSSAGIPMHQVYGDGKHLDNNPR